MPPVHQLSDHAAHRVSDRDKAADTQDFGQRGDIISAILETEPRACTDPVTMAAQVDSDDTEVTRQRHQNLSPVQLGREGDSMDEHERLSALRTGTFPYPQSPAAG